MSDPHNNTTRQDTSSRWVVLRSRLGRWRAAAGWSALAFSAAAGLAAIGIVYWTGESGDFWSGRRASGSAEEIGASEAEEEPAVFDRRPIDGTAVRERAVPGFYAVAIDNMIDARPLSGVAKAAVVIEAPVEGGITRLLAVYPAEDAAEMIGPVRSARPYFLDWAMEFDAVFAHVGGSPEALERISASDVRDLNQFFWGQYYWRDEDRNAPHSTYTSTDLLRQANEKRFSVRTQRPLLPWKFKADAARSARPAQTADLAVEYSAPAYRVGWQYDRDSNVYRRVQGGKPQFDEDGTAVRAKNIVVQYTKVKILDEIGRRRIDTVGKGKALIALDGAVIEGTWAKASLKSRTRYYDASGSEVALNGGATWIEVVPENGNVTFK